MNKETDKKQSSALRRNIIIVAVIMLLGLVCAACVGPLIINPWQENTHYPSPDLPWNGPGSRPVEQYRKTAGIMSPTGYNYSYRWYTSFGHKPEPNHYGQLIDDYVREFDGFENWRSAGSVWDGSETINVKRAPYKFTFLSIQPLIVFMTPQDPNKVIYVAEEGRFVSSRFLENEYYYATSVPNHPDIQWFAPELKLGPKPLEMMPEATEVIEWSDGRLILVEKDGKIVSHRE